MSSLRLALKLSLEGVSGSANQPRPKFEEESMDSDLKAATKSKRKRSSGADEDGPKSGRRDDEGLKYCFH